MPKSQDLPRHVAIIMDGNGRWAQQQGAERLHGHKHGVEAVREVLKTAVEQGIRYLTIYAFSTENWGRPQAEVDGLMRLLGETILAEVEGLRQQGVRMKFIGDLAGLPQEVQGAIERAESVEIEGGEERMTLIIALNYSARWEIAQAAKRVAQKVVDNELKASDITPEMVEQHLCTAGIPDPELLIRTSGEQRLSNFLLWQLSYTELYFTPTLWPQFGREQFLEALAEFSRRERRFGKV